MAEPKRKQRLTREEALEQAITLLEQAGFSVQPPALADIAEKKKATPQALGFAVSRQPKPKAINKSLTRIVLTFAHSINGRMFGPGEVYVKNKNVATHLLNADARAVAQEKRVFDTTPRSYLIVEKRTAAGHIGPGVISSDELDLQHMDNVPLYAAYRG